MNLADKIISLRRKKGWSQEELADYLNVSRQAVSKWESMQSTPDIDKILQLSQLFGVSTDYLLKDKSEEAAVSEIAVQKPLRKVTAEEADAFLKEKSAAAKRVACATFLCIISPVTLIFLLGANDGGIINIAQELAVAIGLITLLLFVAGAVALFILSGSKNNFLFLEEEVFETEKGVLEFAKQKQDEYQNTYTALNVSGISLCILSVIPIFAGLVFNDNAFLILAMVCLMLILAGAGVFLIVRAGVKWSGFQMLLQKDVSRKQEKKNSRLAQTIGTVYWLVVVAAFLIYNFLTEDWGKGWIIWPTAGLIFAAVMVIVKNLGAKN